MATGFTVPTGAVALVAATAKTVIAITASATRTPTLVAADITFDGITATAVPVLVELVAGTAATAGTSTAATPLAIRGESGATAGATAGVAYTAEPTVLTVLKSWYIPPTSGLLQSLPLGREVTGTVAAASARKVLGIRCTAPAAVNACVNLEFED